MFTIGECAREVWGAGENLLICGNGTESREEFLPLWGNVQCVYLDPPFMTGDRLQRTRPYGEKGWRTGHPAPKYEAYLDRFDGEQDYLRMLEGLVDTAHMLLNDTGVLYLHLDWRMNARGRLLCDEIFGGDRFLNEIIWGYESGGRSKKHFSRKHDTILLYARSPRYRFDLTRVPLERKTARKNHLARGVDETGKKYSFVVVGGKEYRYYDDDPVYPGDVWTDISHLQQRDPERTGYATQKPLKLLNRLLRPVTEPGDWVVDLCCGSGTTLEAAQRLGCRFAGVDASPEAIAIAQARLKPENLTLVCPTVKDDAVLLAREGIGCLRVEGLEAANPAFPKQGIPLDNLEAWAPGRLEGDTFYPTVRFQRSAKAPVLEESLFGEPGNVSAVMTTDAAGTRRIFFNENAGGKAYV